ncbi:MAG: helix-turn-helix domain-containing protein [Polyangiales bacterium]
MGYKRSEISSAQIVQAAIRVLARAKGYARTSLLDIAREAGMSKGAVHYHFPTKEALIEVVLAEACDVVQRRTLGWPADQPPLLGLRRALEALWEVRATRTDEALVVADLLAQSLSDPKLRRASPSSTSAPPIECAPRSLRTSPPRASSRASRWTCSRAS